MPSIHRPREKADATPGMHVIAETQKRNFWQKLKRNKALLLMTAPVLIFFFIFNYMPLPGIYLAFVKYNYQQGMFGSPFVGLDNFQYLFQSGKLLMLTRNTVLYNVAFIVIGNILQIFVAVLLNEVTSKKFRKVSQTLMFLPYFISAVVVGVLVYNIVNFDYGFLNNMLKSFGGEPISVYGTPAAWPIIIIAANLWQGVGYGSIVYFATITGIDSQIVEAASIDGANGWQRIRYIILPHLKPTFVILLLFALGGVMKGNFGLFYNLVGNNSTLFPMTDIIETFVYRSMMVNFDFSMGSAVSLYQSIFGCALVMICNAVVRKIEPDYSLF